jgi:hypothetical protein
MLGAAVKSSSFLGGFDAPMGRLWGLTVLLVKLWHPITQAVVEPFYRGAVPLTPQGLSSLARLG